MTKREKEGSQQREESRGRRVLIKRWLGNGRKRHFRTSLGHRRQGKGEDKTHRQRRKDSKAVSDGMFPLCSPSHRSEGEGEQKLESWRWRSLLQHGKLTCTGYC